MNEKYRLAAAARKLRTGQAELEERPRDWFREFWGEAVSEVDQADFTRAHQALVSSMASEECKRNGAAVYMPGVERAAFALLVDAYQRGLSGELYSKACPIPRAVLLFSKSLLWAYLLGRDHIG